MIVEQIRDIENRVCLPHSPALSNHMQSHNRLTLLET